MAHIRCSFKGGKIDPIRLSGGVKGEYSFLGSGWRGVLIVFAAILCLYGLWELGLIAFGLACIWSLGENILKKWRQVYTGQRVLHALSKGKVDEALSIGGEPGPDTVLWWNLLFALFQQQRWQEAVQWLDDLGEGEKRDYLLGVAKLGLNRPEETLRLAPPKSEGAWRMLKAQALFQMQEWQKVLSLLRGSSLTGRGADYLEQIWLKGGSYFFLGEHKSAAHLLRQVVERGGEDYFLAQTWLQEAQEKLKKG
jgi:tetratricopeptide (TPR) repeat protein